MAEERLSFDPSLLIEVLNARKTELIALCKDRGISTTGSKETLRKRLLCDIGKQKDIVSRELLRESFNDLHIAAAVAEESSEILSIIDVSNATELESRAAALTQNIKEDLIRRSRELRLRGKVRNPLMLSTTALAETTSLSILKKEFQAHSTETIPTRGNAGYTFETFCK